MILKEWATVRRGLCALTCGLALLSCASDSSDEADVRVEPTVELPRDVPPLKDYGGIGGTFELQDQRGEVFRLEQLEGRPAMLFFGYTYCPDICPVTLSKMAAVYRLLDLKPTDLQTIFITVDPERDTQEKLAEYLAYFQIGALGLTGTPDKIDAVVRQYGGYYTLNKQEESADYFADHSTYTYLIDQQGQVRFLFRHGDSPEYMAAVSRQLF